MCVISNVNIITHALDSRGHEYCVSEGHRYYIKQLLDRQLVAYFAVGNYNFRSKEGQIRFINP